MRRHDAVEPLRPRDDPRARVPRKEPGARRVDVERLAIDRARVQHVDAVAGSVVVAAGHERENEVLTGRAAGAVSVIARGAAGLAAVRLARRAGARVNAVGREVGAGLAHAVGRGCADGAVLAYRAGQGAARRAGRTGQVVASRARPGAIVGVVRLASGGVARARRLVGARHALAVGGRRAGAAVVANRARRGGARDAGAGLLPVPGHARRLTAACAALLARAGEGTVGREVGAGLAHAVGGGGADGAVLADGARRIAARQAGGAGQVVSRRTRPVAVIGVVRLSARSVNRVLGSLAACHTLAVG